MKFSEVIGQHQLIARVRKLVDEDRLPHALMLCGEAGRGKMALALALASYLLGEKDTEDAGEDFFMGPITQEQMARKNTEAMLRKWEHPDLHFTFPVIKMPNTSADHPCVSEDYMKEWRQMLLESPYFTFEEWLERMNVTTQQARIFVAESDSLFHKLSLKSNIGGYKVSLIWLPEYMKPECANKMLKLLEEPPAQTVFLLVCEHPEQLLETIRSRVQRIDVKRIEQTDMEQALQQRRGLEPDTATRIARMAAGNWNKAVELIAGENESTAFFEEYKTLMRLVYQRRVKELSEWSSRIHEDYGRERLRALLHYFQRMTRENFMFNFGKPELCYMTAEEEDFARKFAKFVNEANVVEMDELFEQSAMEIAQNTTPKIVLFDMTLQLIILLLRK